MLSSIENTLILFFEKLTETLGFAGYLAIALGVEVLFVLAYGIKSAFSYEARFKRVMHKANEWLFINKKLTPENIRQFTNLLKKAPARVTYYWQQYIMYREGGPAAYMTEANLLDKPLKTSSWLNNVKNLNIVTNIWTIASVMFGLAAQSINKGLSFANIMVTLLIPLSVAFVGGIAAIMIKGFRVYSLDDIYESYHIFARFLTNACDELPPYIELDALYTKKELSKASMQLKEFYESNARKAKAAFEEAKRNDERVSEFDFTEMGMDGALLLDRAMKESEEYINQKTKIQSQIAQVEAQKDAMRRNYENVQMELQRKIQATKENIQKLIEQQAATTSRIEVGLLRQQQDKEAKKLEELQRDYDKEETRYTGDRDEHEKEIAALREVMNASLEVAERGMKSEYQSFVEKLMKSAYAVAEKKVEKERKEIEKLNARNEQELISVQTQIKRLLDENTTLRAKLEEYNPDFKGQTNTPQGHYDEKGNYVYADGSYHDENGLFHDIDGNVYNTNGELVSKDYTEEEAEQKAQEDLVNGQINQFGAYINADEGVVTPSAKEDYGEVDAVREEAVQETVVPEVAQPAQIPAEAKVEDFVWDEETPVAETPKAPIVEDFVWDETETVAPAKEEVKQPELAVEDDFVWDMPETETTEPAVEEDAEEPAELDDEEVEEETTEVVHAPVRKAYTGKKRGRPRKVVSVANVQPVKRRGRPKKEEAAPAEPVKRRGRPRKVEAAQEAPKKTTAKPKQTTTKKTTAAAEPAKKRGRPRKEVENKPKRGRPRKDAQTAVASKATKQASAAQTTARPKPRKKVVKPATVVAEPAKKRGRPRKTEVNQADVDSVAKISQLINEEEEKLSKMKAMINNELDQAMVDDQKIDDEKNKLVKEFEDLKSQATTVQEGATSEELASINSRLQDLIKEINLLNNKK